MQLPVFTTHHRVFDRVHQADDVGSTSQVFKNFDFPFDLLLLDRLRDKMRFLFFSRASSASSSVPLTGFSVEMLGKKTRPRFPEGNLISEVLLKGTGQMLPRITCSIMSTFNNRQRKKKTFEMCVLSSYCTFDQQMMPESCES